MLLIVIVLRLIVYDCYCVNLLSVQNHIGNDMEFSAKLRGNNKVTKILSNNGYDNKIQTIIHVPTGEVKVGRSGSILKSNAIASCVVIAAYDSKQKVGGLAHVMVPGNSPEGRTSQTTRYATDAIEELVKRMTQLGVNIDDVEACLVGGGNVLKRKDDTICQDNISSVTNILNEKGIKIRAQAVGGTERRSISLDIEKECVQYTEGDSKRKILWSANERQREIVEG